MNRPAANTVRRRFFTALGQAIHLAWPVLSTILAIQIALGLLIGFVEGWSLGDAVYFTFVTGLTIGYGDIVPRQPPCAQRSSTAGSTDASIGPVATQPCLLTGGTKQPLLCFWRGTSNISRC